MEKELFTIATVIILLTVSLCGCNKTSNVNGWNKKVEIISYSIETYKSVEEKISDGFVYNKDAKFYMVKGIVRNIAGKMLDKVTVIVKFYDINNTFLREESTHVNDLEKHHTWDFEIFYLSSWDHFKEVDHIQFDIQGY